MNRSVKHIMKIICTGLVLSFAMGIAGCGSFAAGNRYRDSLTNLPVSPSNLKVI